MIRAATRGVHPVVRQLGGARHMHPVQLPRYPYPRLIVVQHRPSAQGVRDLLFHPRQPGRARLDRRLQRPFGGGVPKQVAKEGARARVGHQVVRQQVHRQRFDPGTVLHRGRHRCRGYGYRFCDRTSLRGGGRKRRHQRHPRAKAA